jgi:hypothetical protein
LLTLFRGKGLQHFKEYTRTVDSLNEDQVKRDKTPWDNDQKFFEVLDRVAKEFFPVKHAYRRQCFYLRYHLYIGGKFGVREFMARLHRINACIPYFPRKSDTQGIKYCKGLPDDELCDILNLAKKPEWTVKMLEANQDAYDYDLHGLTEYLERLETATAISAKHSSPKHDKTSKATEKSRKRKNGNGHGNGNGNSESRSFKRTGNSNNNQPFKKQKRTQCTIFEKFHKGECFFKNKPDTESNTKTNGSRLTVKQYANLMQSMMANASAFTPSKKKKRKVAIVNSDDEEENTFQINKDVDGCSSDDDEKRVMPCANFLAECHSIRKRTIDIKQRNVRTTINSIIN